MNKRKKVIKLVSWVCFVLLVCLMTVIAAGCQGDTLRQIQTASPTPTSTSTITPVPPTTPPEEASVEPTEEQVLLTPTLAPTATPSQLDIVVEDVTQRVGIDELTIFGLDGEELISLLVSLLIVLVGSLLGVLLVNGLLWLAKRTPPKFDDRLLESIHKQLKWLIALILLQFATQRLAFLSPEVKQWLDLVYFALYVLVIASLVWKLIDYGLEGLILKTSPPESQNLLVTFTPLIRRSIQGLIFLVSLGIILDNFGFNLSALLAVLGLGGLAVSLAAKETLEDMINGFIILIDQPFRIGDRIKIESMDTWGDVVAIGSRTTQIRTIDNRLVIIPNSIIGRSQVENFTYPDPSYRVEVSLGIGYGSDIDQVIEIITNAMLRVPGIMESKPPFVDFVEFGDSAMIFRAYYWLKTYEDLRLRTQVNKSISDALEEANVEMPFVTYDVNLAYKEKPNSENNTNTT
jgi:small-conductance mechanosensitive channel